MDSLLARFAESFFWMARYMERAENLARILDVNATFARNSEGESDWLPVVQMQTDEASFFARHPSAVADAVTGFYLLDRENPNSVLFSVRAARENARSLRHLISLELWSQLNIFYNDLTALQPEDIGLARLSALCSKIKEGCQLHAGIAEGTLHRDQGWYFYSAGKNLERADQMTRLLDVQYLRLLAAPEPPRSSVEASQWNALLRSAAAYHAFRRIHSRGMSPTDVAGFLLLNRAFPRSVRACIGEVHHRFAALTEELGVERARASAASAADLDAALGATDVSRLMPGGLHPFLDDLQTRFGNLSSGLAAGVFFQESAPTMTQSQTQG